MADAHRAKRWVCWVGVVSGAGIALAVGCSDEETTFTPAGTITGTGTGAGTGTATGTATGAGTGTGTGTPAGTATGSGVGGAGGGGEAGSGGAAGGAGGQGGGAQGGGPHGGGGPGGSGQGGSACLTCSQIWPAGDTNDLCTSSATLYTQLQTCVCTTSCSTQCAGLVDCGGGLTNPTGNCTNCINASCSNEAGACSAD